MPYRGHFWNMIPALYFLVGLDPQSILWKFEPQWKNFTLDLGAWSFVSGVEVTSILLRSGAQNHHLIKQLANIFVFVIPTKTHSFTSDAFFVFGTHLRSNINYLIVSIMTAVEEYHQLQWKTLSVIFSMLSVIELHETYNAKSNQYTCV